MMIYSFPPTSLARPERISRMISVATVGMRRFATIPKQRSFMSSMTVSAPEEDGRFALILGKPGGGKGTISGKILKVRSLKFQLLSYKDTQLIYDVL